MKLIFEEYLSGRTSKQIADLLNSKGSRSRSGGKWYGMTISRILKNLVYCGYMEWDGILRRGDHRTILEVSMFNEVQREIVRRIRKPYQKYEPRQIEEERVEEESVKSRTEASETA